MYTVRTSIPEGAYALVVGKSWKQLKKERSSRSRVTACIIATIPMSQMLYAPSILAMQSDKVGKGEKFNIGNEQPATSLILSNSWAVNTNLYLRGPAMYGSPARITVKRKKSLVGSLHKFGRRDKQLKKRNGPRIKNLRLFTGDFYVSSPWKTGSILNILEI